MKYKTSKLNEIVGIHESLQDALRACEICSPIIKDSNLFSTDALLNYLKIKPFVIIEDFKTSRKYLVAGFREWILANSILPSDAKLKCAVVDEAQDSILELAWSDAYMTSLLFSVHPKHCAIQLACLSKTVPKNIQKKLYHKMANIKQLEKATAISRSSFYKKYGDKKTPNFDDFMSDF